MEPEHNRASAYEMMVEMPDGRSPRRVVMIAPDTTPEDAFECAASKFGEGRVSDVQALGQREGRTPRGGGRRAAFGGGHFRRKVALVASITPQTYIARNSPSSS